MKKKLLSGLAIGFASCFAFGAVGCSDAQQSGVGGGEEQVYSAFKSAYQATMNYTGAITLNGTYVEQGFYGTEEYDEEAGMTYSVNYQTGVGYYTEWEIDDGEKEEGVYRITTYNGGYIMQNYEKENGEEYRYSNILNDAEYAAFKTSSWKDYAEINFDEMEVVAQLNSFTTYKNALVQFNAMMASEFEAREIDGAYNMSVSATTENGAQVITTTTQMERAENGEKMVMSQTTKMYAQGGKISKFVLEGKQQYKEGDKVIGEATTDMTMSLDYKFDQVGYNDAGSKMDTNATPTEREYGDWLASQDVALFVNGEKVYDAYASIQMGDSLETVKNKLFNNSVISSLNIEGWYVDEACTQAYNPTTWEQFLSVDTLYTKNATVKENCALIFYRTTTELSFSEETLYRVFGVLAEHQDDWDYRVMSHSGSYDFAQNWQYSSADKVIVNYEQTNETSISYQLGYVYFIEYVEVLTDADIIENLISMH